MPRYQYDYGVSYLNSKVAFGVGDNVSETTIQSTSTINSGNWVHVACTRKRVTGEMKIYVNGVLETTGTGPTGSNTAPSVLHIGNIQTNINYFNGAIDQLKIYNTVLGDGDIAALASEGGMPTQYTITASAGTGGTITPSGAVQVAPGANQTFTITPNSGYYISSVVVDSVNQGSLASYTFTNVQANHTITASFTATSDLVAYYRFDETSGTTAYDCTANAKNGTLYGSCTWATGLTNNAVSIPGGSSDYVGLPTGIDPVLRTSRL